MNKSLLLRQAYRGDLKGMMSIVCILFFGVIVYCNTFFCSFHFDDSVFIVDNPAIQNIHNLQNIWAFFSCRFITFLSFALNYHFHKFDVFGYHLVNLAIHLISAVLVWWLVRLTLSTPVMKDNKIARHADLIALFAGLIFVTHPVQTQAVTYIWQRAASLATLFYVASLCLYVKSREGDSPQKGDSPFQLRWKLYYTGALITAIMAMFTKETAITLPLMILLYEFMFIKGGGKLNWKRIFPFMCTIFIIPVVMMVTHTAKDGYIQGSIEVFGGMTRMQYVLTQFRVMITYIRLVFLPFNQNIDYDYRVFKNILELPVLISFSFLIAILLWARSLFSKYRLLSFSIFWFFLTLLPESIPFPRKDVIFEHRLYLPLVGYSMFAVSGLYYLCTEKTLKAMVIALMMIVTWYSVLTFQRNMIWKDEFTLWNDAIYKSPHKARPYYTRGCAYYNQGNLSYAILDYNKAIELDPKYANAYYNRGIVYYKQGRFAQAISDDTQAIEIRPEFAKAYNNRGDAYYVQGNFLQAVSDYTKAIDIAPKYEAEAYCNRGFVYYKQGRLIQAISDYTKAIEIAPGNATVYYNRGLAYFNQADLIQAVFDYTKAIEIDPMYTEAYYNRGLTYYRQGNLNQAISDYTKAIEINATLGEAYNNRGSVYGNKGNWTKAISDFDKAIEINPKNVDAYNNRVIGYYNLKKYDKAWGDVHKVEELRGHVNPIFLKALKVASGKDK